MLGPFWAVAVASINDVSFRGLYHTFYLFLLLVNYMVSGVRRGVRRPRAVSLAIVLALLTGFAAGQSSRGRSSLVRSPHPRSPCPARHAVARHLDHYGREDSGGHQNIEMTSSLGRLALSPPPLRAPNARHEDASGGRARQGNPPASLQSMCWQRKREQGPLQLQLYL